MLSRCSVAGGHAVPEELKGQGMERQSGEGHCPGRLPGPERQHPRAGAAGWQAQQRPGPAWRNQRRGAGERQALRESPGRAQQQPVWEPEMYSPTVHPSSARPPAGSQHPGQGPAWPFYSQFANCPSLLPVTGQQMAPTWLGPGQLGQSSRQCRPSSPRPFRGQWSPIPQRQRRTDQQRAHPAPMPRPGFPANQQTLHGQTAGSAPNWPAYGGAQHRAAGPEPGPPHWPQQRRRHAQSQEMPSEHMRGGPLRLDPVFMPVAAPAAAPAARAARVPGNWPNWHNRSYRSNHPPAPECFAGPSEGFQPRPSPWWEPLHVSSFADAPPEMPQRMNCGWSPRDGADNWRSWPDPQQMMSDIRSHMPEMASVMRDINMAVAHMQQQTDQAGHEQDHGGPRMDRARRQTESAGPQTDQAERQGPRQQRREPLHAARQTLGQRRGEGRALHEEPLPSPQEPLSRGRRRGRSRGCGRGQNRSAGCTGDDPLWQAVRRPDNGAGCPRLCSGLPAISSEDTALAGLDVAHCTLGDPRAGQPPCMSLLRCRECGNVEPPIGLCDCSLARLGGVQLRSDVEALSDLYEDSADDADGSEYSYGDGADDAGWHQDTSLHSSFSTDFIAELESDPELRTLTQRIWATNWSHTLDFVLSGNHRLSPEDREFLHEQLQEQANEEEASQAAFEAQEAYFSDPARRGGEAIDRAGESAAMARQRAADVAEEVRASLESLEIKHGRRRHQAKRAPALMRAMLCDAAFVSRLLKSLPGVDTNDPIIWDVIDDIRK